MSSADARIPVPKPARRRIQKVFDGGAHFDEAAAATDPSNLEGREVSVTPDKEQIFLDALAVAGSAELRRVRVEIEDGHVRLSGRVSTYYLKQVAQEVSRPFAIGLQISNDINVVS